jgi:excinuclease ABC subunit C
MCYKNIYEFAYKKHISGLNTKNFTKGTCKNILFKLWFERINKNIIFECNDISHLSWSYTVASRSVIENWKTNSSKYRKYKIKTLKDQEINDFDSMREVITRRLAELDKIWNIPDLIVIDWWKPQLSSVKEIVNKSIYKNKLNLIWIAKKEEILYKLEDWKFEEIILDKDSLELRLIQKLRDEAHRFAITFNRDSRIKASKKNILESLPWIWPKTRKKILKQFGSVENLKDVNRSDLEKIVNKGVIWVLEDHGII